MFVVIGQIIFKYVVGLCFYHSEKSFNISAQVRVSLLTSIISYLALCINL